MTDKPGRLEGDRESPPSLRAALHHAKLEGPAQAQLEESWAAIQMRLVEPERLIDVGAKTPTPLNEALSRLALEEPSVEHLAAIRRKLIDTLNPPAVSPSRRLGRRRARSRFIGFTLAALASSAAAATIFVIVDGASTPEPSHEPKAVAPVSSPLSGPPARRSPRDAGTHRDGGEGPRGTAPSKSVPRPEPAAQPKLDVRGSSNPPQKHGLGRAPAMDPLAELQLIRQAQELRHTDPARVVSLTREHRLQHPSGVMAQERDVLLIEAYMDLGDAQAAAREAERFRRLYPSSVHLRRIDSILSPRRPLTGGPGKAPIP